MRISDWSSDVCSSDLGSAAHDLGQAALLGGVEVRFVRIAVDLGQRLGAPELLALVVLGLLALLLEQLVAGLERPGQSAETNSVLHHDVLVRPLLLGELDENLIDADRRDGAGERKSVVSG